MESAKKRQKFDEADDMTGAAAVLASAGAAAANTTLSAEAQAVKLLRDC